MSKTEKLITQGCEVLSNQWQLDAETARAIMRQLLTLAKKSGLKFMPNGWVYPIAKHPDYPCQIEDIDV